MRLVGNGLGKSLGSGCSFPSSHTRLPSLRKGKDRVRDVLGERSGVPEGEVRLGSAMSDVTRTRGMEEDGVQCWMLLLLLLLEPHAENGPLTRMSVRWRICESVCLEMPAAVWDTGSADKSRSALSLQVCQEDLL